MDVDGSFSRGNRIEFSRVRNIELFGRLEYDVRVVIVRDGPQLVTNR